MVAATRTRGEVIAKKVENTLNPPPVGEAINQLSTLRDAKRKLEAQIKLIEDEYHGLEIVVMEALDAAGLAKASGAKATASITMGTVGNVLDWDSFEAYVKKTGHFHLFQRRLSDPGLREIWDSGKKIPGVEPFVKRRLNLRDL